MVDSRFFKNEGPHSLEFLAHSTGCKLILSNGVSENTLITDVKPLDEAGHGHITFFSNPKYINDFKSTQATCCIVDEKYQGQQDEKVSLLISSNPYKTYAEICAKFYNPYTKPDSYISERSCVDISAHIGKDCYIGPNVFIGKNVKIGSNSRIESGTYIGDGVEIGHNANIFANCVITHSIIGDDFFCLPGVNIGQDGFGFATDSGKHIKVPQIGKVIIGNDVEIGSGTCIDRGSAKDTVIGDNCRIDNLVQIAHNVKLGKGCIVVSQVGIAGSTEIGDYAVFGGQVGIAGHLKIGSKVQVMAQSGITKDIAESEIVAGTPAVSVSDWRRQVAAVRKLVRNS